MDARPTYVYLMTSIRPEMSFALTFSNVNIFQCKAFVKFSNKDIERKKEFHKKYIPQKKMNWNSVFFVVVMFFRAQLLFEKYFNSKFNTKSMYDSISRNIISLVLVVFSTFDRTKSALICTK